MFKIEFKKGAVTHKSARRKINEKKEALISRDILLIIMLVKVYSTAELIGNYQN